MAEQLRIEGGRRLRSTLRKAGADLKDLSKLNKAAAGVVVPVAKAATPYGPAAGGHLKPTVRAGATQKAGIIRVGSKAKPYGGPVHWGWPAKNIKANTWLTAAAAATEPQWTELYWSGLLRIIDNIEGDT